MMKTKTQRLLVVLLAGTSIGTTVLIAINLLSRYRHTSISPAVTLQGKIISHGSTHEPPVLLTLPQFTLTDQSGQPFGQKQLNGKVWIADFIFTRCSGPCPMMTSQMAQLQDRLKEHPDRQNIRLVSISVDPEHDTPATLQEYARLARADDQLWRFLTGPREDVWQLIKSGFKLPVGDAPDNAQMPIFHSQKFVLVDAQSRVRGFYDGPEATDPQKLLGNLQRVLDERDAQGLAASLDPTHNEKP